MIPRYLGMNLRSRKPIGGSFGMSGLKSPNPHCHFSDLLTANLRE